MDNDGKCDNGFEDVKLSEIKVLAFTCYDISMRQLYCGLIFPSLLASPLFEFFDPCTSLDLGHNVDLHKPINHFHLSTP